jgi:hypothetical protein
MPRLGAIEKEEVKSIILVCRARGYNYKQILSVVNDSLRLSFFTFFVVGLQAAYIHPPFVGTLIAALRIWFSQRLTLD